MTPHYKLRHSWDVNPCPNRIGLGVRYVRITHIFINLDDEIGERFCHRLQKHDFFALADLEAFNDGCRHFLWREQGAIKTL